MNNEVLNEAKNYCTNPQQTYRSIDDRSTGDQFL